MLETLNSISDSWWNSRVLTDLATGVGKEQLKRRERVNSRYFCLERFGTVRPYMYIDYMITPKIHGLPGFHPMCHVQAIR